MESIHEGRVTKRAFERIWDTLGNRERDIIAGDVGSESELTKWFNSTVAQTAKSRYESAAYWMNDIETFKRSKHQEA